MAEVSIPYFEQDANGVDMVDPAWQHIGEAVIHSVQGLMATW